ncbi:MAG: helix-turn-helix domain-containing protein [Saprospiraceae bacterium]
MNTTMRYKEFEVSSHFSQHIECYWELELAPDELDSPFEALSPDCTFDIVFADTIFNMRGFSENVWKGINPGATFFGQKTSGVNFAVHKAIKIFGVRFKPFAFANLIKTPLFHLNDQVLPLEKLFDLNVNDQQLIHKIITAKEVKEKIGLTETLFNNLFKNSFSIDQNLRAQLNYILDRKGDLKVKELFPVFGVSKATLHKHFIHKIGLSPKKISCIWRINYFLQLQNKYPNYNLTELSLEAGFYDQAHFIKTFKAYFGSCPLRFFKRENQLIKISQTTINKRFSNQYDPR